MDAYAAQRPARTAARKAAQPSMPTMGNYKEKWKNMAFESVKESVAAGDTESAMLDLLNLVKGRYKEYENDAILFSGKFQQWKREKILGISENEQKEWNKINYSILQLIALIEFEKQEQENTEVEGYLLVRYWLNKKRKDDHTINNDENENLQEPNELKKDNTYSQYGVVPNAA